MILLSVFLGNNTETSDLEEFHICSELLICLHNGKARKSRGQEEKPKPLSKNAA